MEIILVRHGQTEWNLLKKVQGKADIELNENGIEQAKKTRDLLKDEKIDCIICSPLKRAVQTANIINETRNLPMVIDERVSERDFGEFEGRPTSEFDFEGFWSYKQDNKYVKAENIKEFFDRVYDFLDKIQKEYEGKRVLIVAHGGISIPIKCYFDGIPDQETLLPLALANCEAAKYIFK